MELTGKLGLVVGVANEHSIAWGCAKAFKQGGADLVLTYINDKAKPYVEPLARQLGAELFPLDVQSDEQMDALFYALQQKGRPLDFLLHSIAFAPKDDLHGRVIDCSREGFLKSMDISCHSFLRMAHLAEPLMPKADPGGCLLTVTYHGSQQVVANYNMMGPVKAALESSVKYLADELGPHGLRVNALSPGPLLTRAASGIDDFEGLMEKARARAPQHQIVTIDDVGAYARFLVSDAAQHITGNICYVDAGLNVRGV